MSLFTPSRQCSAGGPELCCAGSVAAAAGAATRKEAAMTSRVFMLVSPIHGDAQFACSWLDDMEDVGSIPGVRWWVDGVLHARPGLALDRHCVRIIHRSVRSRGWETEGDGLNPYHAGRRGGCTGSLNRCLVGRNRRCANGALGGGKGDHAWRLSSLGGDRYLRARIDVKITICSFLH